MFEDGEKFKIVARFQEIRGEGTAEFTLVKDFEQKRDILGNLIMRKKTSKEEEQRTYIHKKVTLDELAMQAFKFDFDISEGRTLHFKYGIGSSNPGFFLRVGVLNENKRNFNKLPSQPLHNEFTELMRGIRERVIEEVKFGKAGQVRGKSKKEFDLYYGDERELITVTTEFDSKTRKVILAA